MRIGSTVPRSFYNGPRAGSALVASGCRAAPSGRPYYRKG